MTTLIDSRTIKTIAWLLIGVSVLYGMHIRYANIKLTEVDNPIRSDALDYFNYAKNISEYSVFSRQFVNNSNRKPPEPDSLRSPGFPIFASLFMSGDYDASIRRTLIAQSVLQFLSFLLLSIVLLYSLGVYWSIPAIFLIFTFPHFVSINTYYLSESLFLSLIAIMFSLLWFVSNHNRFSIRYIIICGALFGCASLVRPVVQYFPFFLLLLSGIFFKKEFKLVAIFFVVSSIPVLLWGMRNYIVLGAWSDPTLTINALYHGSFPNFMFNNDPSTFGFPYRFDPRANEVYGGVSVTLALIWERFVSSPFEYLKWYLVEKQFFLWQWNIVAGYGDIYIYPITKSPFIQLPDMAAIRAFHHLIHGILVVLALVTALVLLVISFAERVSVSKFWVAVSIFILYAVLIHAVIAPFPRYGIPFKLLLFPLSIFGVKEIVVWLAKLRVGT